ncbi:MAG: hypothetical protein V1772_01570, partial [Chloroflexota bacterium]
MCRVTSPRIAPEVIILSRKPRCLLRWAATLLTLASLSLTPATPAPSRQTALAWGSAAPGFYAARDNRNL